MNPAVFTGKEVLVMGLGLFGGGVDAAEFAARSATRVVVTDMAPEEKLRDSVDRLRPLPNVEFRLGSHDPADFERADVVIVNPAVPPGNSFVLTAQQNGKWVTSQVGLFFQLCPARIVGITGANGKSTTTTLTAYLLENAPKPRSFERVWLSGNIGDQPLLTILDDVGPDDIVVLELSSFQIEQLAAEQRAPHISLLTNLTPNHLDRYGTFDAYCASKKGIFDYQNRDGGSTPAISIFNAEDEIATRWFARYRQQSQRTCLTFSADDVDPATRRAYRLPGRAYLSNLAAAMAIVRCLDVSDDSIRACLSGFKGLPHRLELVAEAHGVRWFNDSKATTPLSAIVALEAFDGPEILIAGGYDKHLPLDGLARKIVEKAKAVILIGQTAPKIARAVETVGNGDVSVEIVASLAQAVESARRQAVAGDVVLLSPGCASYDMFTNYEHRGEAFCRLVMG